jgi:hypothetical protein
MREEEINELNEKQAIKNLFFVETETILGILEDKQDAFGLKEKSGNMIQVETTENIRHFCRLVILSRLNPEGIVPESDKRKITQALLEVFIRLYPLWEPEGAMKPLEDIVYNLLSNNPEESCFSQEEVDEFLSNWDDKDSRSKVVKKIFAKLLALEDQKVAEDNEETEEM